MLKFLSLFKRQRPIIQLATGLFLVLISFMLSGQLRTERESFKLLQAKILAECHSLENFSLKITRVISNKAITNWDLINYAKEYNNDVHAQIFRKDSVLAWTENRANIAQYILNKKIQSVFANDGVYLVHSNKVGDYHVVTYQKIRTSYSIRNSFLTETSSKTYESYNIEELTNSASILNIRATDGTFLFGVKFSNNADYIDFKAFSGFFLFLVGLVFIVFVLVTYISRAKRISIDIYQCCIIAVIVGFRAAFLLKFPTEFFDLPIFSPYYYASNWFSASLADAFLNAATLMVLTYFALYQFSFRQNLLGIQVKNFDRFLVYYLSVIWFLLLWFSRDLVSNSSFDFVFTNPFEISTAVIVGLLCTMLLLSSLLAVMNRAFQLFDLARIKLYLLDLSVALPPAFLINYLITNRLSFFLLIPAAIYFAYFVVKRFQVFTSSTVLIAVALTIMSLIFSVYLLKIVHEKEYAKRKMLLYAIESRNNDPLALANFLLQRDALQHDEKFISIAQKRIESTENEIIDYIRLNYFQGFWSQFTSNITICKPNDQLIIKPEGIETNCYDYFRRIEGVPSDTLNNSDFKSINSNQCLNGYIGRIIINEGTSDEFGIFIEFVTRLLSNDFSLPELFVDQRIIGELNLGNYSLARYTGANLLAKTGEFDFPQILNHAFVSNDIDFYTNYNQYNHLVINTGNNERLILSKPISNYTEVFSIFTFVWLFLVLIFLLTSFIYRLLTIGAFNLPTFYLSTRIQIFIIFFIFVSFAAIGFFSISFYRDFYERKNLDFIKDKVHSIQIEILSKIANIGSINQANHAHFETYVAKFASIFFTDIHIYKPEGVLYATSRPELFEMGFISNRLNPKAFQAIINNREAIYVTRETIGSLSYYSAYIPIVDNENRVSGIINVPFFARHAEFQRDVSKYLATFVNVFLFLAILAVFFAIIITNYFVKPLHTLSRYFSQLTIGRKNITIPIFRKDELGQLIELYNEMVVQLDETVHQLKERERESAWKEVAKQVAHEIKNPLTPIKLGLQFLIRTKKDNDPEWNNRFSSFSETLLVQIESMTQMANSFSEFTRLPEAVFTQVKVEELLAPSVMVLNEYTGRFDVDNQAKELILECDKIQIIRVLVNLLKNAEQAVRGSSTANIQVIVNVIDKDVIFSISDNGIGILNENLDQIFKPNFTTKSSGMGLGLFMSKVIVENHKGRLWFNSTAGLGTTFYVCLPINQSMATD